MALMLPDTLADIPQRTPELGRIRLGEKGDRGQPVKLRTFRLTSHSKALLEAAAKLYGGTVKAWDGAPDEGMWQVTTAASELDVLIPGAAGAVSQSYELWKGGTCMRRCDGATARTPEPEPRPCVCAALGQQGPDRDCEVVTRFRVILPRVPGLGVWMLTTSGWMAATTLPSTLALLARMTSGEWIPAVLRAEQRSKKVRDPQSGKVQTNRFVVPVLDLPGATIGQLVEGAGLVDSPVPLDAVVPTTAKERALARAAQLDTGPTTSAPTSGGTGASTDASPVAAHPAGDASAAHPAPEEAPSAAGADDAEVIDGTAVEVTGEVVGEGVASGELREWLRAHRITIPVAREVCVRMFQLDSFDALTDVQRGHLILELDAGRAQA